MLTGWRHFGRKPQTLAAATPDDAVRGPRTWLMVAVIIASSAALLGTSDDTSSTANERPTQFNTTYTFERTGIEGGSVDLTADQPRVTFYVNIHADDLGPEGSVSTTTASATLHAAIEGSGFSNDNAQPYVMFKLSSAGMGSGTQTQALDQYTNGTSLIFTGNCQAPTQGDACHTSLALELGRNDEGSRGGTVHVSWTLDVHSSGLVPGASEASTVGPSDPPWTIEVLQ